KTVLSHGFKIWHRIKSIDPDGENKNVYARPRLHYPASHEVVFKTAHGYNVLVDGKDIEFTPKIIFGDYYEQREEEFAQSTVRGGDWVVVFDLSGSSFCML